MSALSPLFLWLIPLALLPVIIHLLNRLRYQTVHWAAMMFLRTADRDASRRAKIRQWIILAARCLMLLMFLLALARLQSKGRIARFFDPGSQLVVILFDRSASMEHQRGGVSGRERALTLLQQGLQELDRSARVVWIDSVTGEALPLPAGVDLDLLPFTAATSTSSNLPAAVRLALAEIARAEVTDSEIWIATDRQTSAWLPEGSASPDWSEWSAFEDQVRLRILDVAQVRADPGNRALSLTAEPRREGEVLRFTLQVQRDRADPESLALQIDSGGLTVREDILVEGELFQWEQELPLSTSDDVVHARYSVPADTNPRDNAVAVAWQDPGVLVSGGSGLNTATERFLRAGVLPRSGVREWSSASQPDESHLVWMTSQLIMPNSPVEQWIRQGGVLVQWPRTLDLVVPRDEAEPLEVTSWNEADGILSTRGRDPLRLDLLEVFSAVSLEEGDDVTVLARLSDDRPLLTQQSLGDGTIYTWATLPDSGFSNLDDGYVLVPIIQRILDDASKQQTGSGTYAMGAARIDSAERWVPLDDPEADVLVDAGRFRNREILIAQNRPLAENVEERLSVQELEAWAEPLDLRVFEDRSDTGRPEQARSEFTGLLAFLGLVFLMVESWLLTRNIRKKAPAAPSLKGAAA